MLANKDLEWYIEEKSVFIRKSKTSQEASQVTLKDTTINISGRIIDEKGEPIPGTTIKVKGSQRGSTTDVNGTFVLNDLNPNSTLIVTNVAYASKEILVKGKGALGDIRLEESIGKLDETIVIAYGTTSQRISTGSVSTIKAADIEKQPVSNPLLALQGRIPGLFITQATGFTGTGVTVRIQGINSIENGNDPLYVIDGVPFNAQLQPVMNEIMGSSGSSSGSPLDFINPNDIESIDVLKDADATAI